MAEGKKIKRSQFATFLNTTPSGTSATWARMGLGITSQSVSYNPQVTTETYIHEDNARNSVDSYQPSMETTQTAYNGEPIFEYVDELRKKRAVGEDCKSQVLMVYIYDKNADGSYPAEKNDCTIQLSTFGGDGGGNTTVEYTVGLDGDPTEGVVTIAEDGTVTFTETTAEA